MGTVARETMTIPILTSLEGRSRAIGPEQGESSCGGEDQQSSGNETRHLDEMGASCGEENHLG